MITFVSATLGQTTYYVNGTCGDDTWTGTRRVCAAPNGPKRTIQAGIDASITGDTVIVADGTYTGAGNRDLDFGGRDIMLGSENGPANCIIDCEASENDPHRGFYFHNGETEQAVLDGFTIRNGFAGSGGGVLCESSSPSINNCTFSGNVASYRGGGVRHFDSSSRLLNCTFSDNSALYGGGVNISASAIMLIECVFTANSADLHGGAISTANSTPMVTNCTFTANHAASNGGAVRGAGTWENCTFIGNSAGSSGGGMYAHQGNSTLIHCAFIGNSAGWGGGVSNWPPQMPTLTECVFTGNDAVNGGGDRRRWDSDGVHFQRQHGRP